MPQVLDGWDGRRGGTNDGSGGEGDLRGKRSAALASAPVATYSLTGG